MKPQYHVSRHPAVTNPLSLAILATIIVSSPEVLVAAELATAAAMIHKPWVITQTSSSIKKTTPITKSPATFQLRPGVKPRQSEQARAIMPDVIQSKPVNKPGLNSVVHAPSAIGQLPAGSIQRIVPAIQGAEQARQLAATKNALEALRNLPGAPTSQNGMKPNTGLGGTLFPNQGGRHGFDFAKLPGHTPAGLDGVGNFIPDPTTPSNRPSNATGDVFSSAPTTASGNLAGIMGGATEQDTGKQDTADSTVTDVERSDRANRQGGHTATTRIHYSDGSSYLDQRTYNRHGFMIIHQQVRMDRDGYMATRISDSLNGHHWGPWSIHPPVQSQSPNPAENPNPDNGSDDTGAWARWTAKWSGQRPDYSLRTNLNRVNPGPDGVMPNPEAPRLVIPAQQPVINPDPETIQGQDTVPDVDTTKLLHQQLVDKVKGPGNDPSKAGVQGAAAGTPNR